MASVLSSDEEDSVNSDTYSANSDLSETDSSSDTDRDTDGIGLLQIPELSDHETFIKKMSTFTMKQLSKNTFASLLNDYVESEFFLIDGDSLLITCACDETVKEGQNLHFFFLVEQVLVNLSNKGARYVVVFFEDMEHMYMGQSYFISLRTQLKLHLEENTDITVHIFTSFLSIEWKTFLLEECPYFLMVSDNGNNILQTVFLNLLILDALGSKTNIVLTAGQENDALRVYGYHVDSRECHKTYIKSNVKEITSVIKALIGFSQATERRGSLQLIQCLNPQSLEKEVQESISHLSKSLNKESDIRTIITTITCSLLLKIYHEENNPFQVCRCCLTQYELADLCKMYCLTVAVLLGVPLSQRARIRSIKGDWNKHALLFIDMQRRCENITLKMVKTVSKRSNWKIDWTYVSDLNDDLLLKNIAYYYEKEKSTDLKLEFGDEIDKMYRFLWCTTLQLVSQGHDLESFDIRTTSKPFLSNDSSVNGKEEIVSTVGLIPLRSALINEFAGDILEDLPFLSSDDPMISSLTAKNSYDERLHWHSGRQLSDDYDRTKNNTKPLKAYWALKNYQKLQTHLRLYGQSLGLNEAKKIVVEKREQEKENEVHKYSGKKKEPQMKKKDIIIQENARKSKDKEKAKELEQWNVMAPSLEKDINMDFFPGIKKQEKFVRDLETPSVKFSAELATLKICFEVWLEHCRVKTKEHRDINIAVEVMKKIHTIMNNYEELLQRKDRQRIARYLTDMGFENLAHPLQSSKVSILVLCILKAKHVHNDKTMTEYTAGVGVGSARFQMLYMGQYLSREERTDHDPRVQHFIPDSWQRELLDVVDNNESAVIVAPTSSGKTYASYYCMEKVLKRSDEGVVVYVAPTKALVNQVVATVANQFTKTLPNGIALCGVFTRDYRTDALNCQVLVTVPQCLEILLLSPHRQAWAKKIEYIIFDEVHCLGGEIGADVWEHILVMIRCPFLALSATISNPEHLTEWLQSVKQYWKHSDQLIESNYPQASRKDGKNKTLKTKQSYRVRLVSHDKRYNDLEKYVCTVQNDNIIFEHYHPCAALTIDHIKKYGIPKDLSFSPRESIQLYDTMVRVWSECPKLKELDPEKNTFFKDKIVITKNDASQYEEELKTELINWTEKGNQKKTKEVLDQLRIVEPSGGEDSEKCFPNLVEKLHKENKLPALFFMFSVHMVERLASKLGDFLRKNCEKKPSVKDEKEFQKIATKQKKLNKDIAKGLNGNSRSIRKKEALMINIANSNTLNERHKSMMKKTFLKSGYADETTIDIETLQSVLERVKFQRNYKLLNFLARRGIGFHHGSMSSKERFLVEFLFRKGFLRVVTATGTLALGINMPCKSVVFLHDSVYLDALNYRQMSGRAGRRGQDLLGNVFFFGIPMPKVKKLLKSNVPQLKGQFPLSISLVLRVMLLASRADDKEDAKAKALSILKHSLMAFKHSCETQMLKLFCLFSLHYLICERYLDQDCNPMEFAGLVTHLHYHEPSNFVFVSFLEKGLFHDLCQPCSNDQNTFPDSVMENLVMILANLFGRLYMLPHFMRFKVAFHQSKVFLDGLPDDFASALKEHNTKVATLFGHCLLTAAKLADMKKECQLPLSQIRFSGKECTDSALVNHLMDCTEGRSGISPFACLSGNTDHDLIAMKNVQSLMLQTAQIPSQKIPILYLEKRDMSGRKLLLNAYALDFFKHSSLDAIVHDNGFNEGDAYYILKNFSLAISSISVSLREMCEDENDRVVLAFEQLNKEYKEKFNLAFPTYSSFPHAVQCKRVQTSID
ncbi:putative ATP-dependent RNA helicase DDX60 [Pelodytes ibericus]